MILFIAFSFLGCVSIKEKVSDYFLVDELISNAEKLHEKKIKVCGYFKESIDECSLSVSSENEGVIALFFLLDGKGYCSMHNSLHRNKSSWVLLKGEFYVGDINDISHPYKYSIQPAEIVEEVDGCHE